MSNTYVNLIELSQVELRVPRFGPGLRRHAGRGPGGATGHVHRRPDARREARLEGLPEGMPRGAHETEHGNSTRGRVPARRNLGTSA